MTKFNAIRFIVLINTMLVFASTLNAQDRVNTLSEILILAENNYPLLKSKRLEIEAAKKSIDAGKNTFIPSLDAGYQVNYGTFNNITGMVNSQLLVPISGPPSADNRYDGVFGSGANLTLNWQAATFGQRGVQVDLAKAALQFAGADAENELFRHKVKVTAAYLDVLTAHALINIYAENIKRTESNLVTVRSLVVSGIRPGVDTALFKAEISKAKVEWLNNQKYKEQSRIYLSQLLATDSDLSLMDSIFFVRLPEIIPTADSVKNPLIDLYKKNVAIGFARRNTLSKTLMPNLGVWSTLYARGSGVDYNGAVSAKDGLGFQRFNYGVGLQLSVPIMQSFRIKPQLKQQDFLNQSSQEKLNEIQLQLKKQSELADTALNISFYVAKEGPLFLESAIFSYKAMQSRYQSGLANISDLMLAQYTLLKAETDLKLSYMNVWKAYLFKLSVSGDLSQFINQTNVKNQ
jgi:outer membrane protein